MREETGLECAKLRLLGHADAIHYDSAQRVEYHYTILDFGARYIGGEARAGGDVSALTWARRDDLAAYGLWDEVLRMINLAFSQVPP